MTKNENRVIHFLRSGFTFRTEKRGASATSVRGQELELTPEILELSKDRFGSSAWDLSEEQQIARFGEVVFRDGPTPEGVNFWDGDSAAADEERNRRRAIAAAIADETERAQALSKIARDLGYAETGHSIDYGARR